MEWTLISCGLALWGLSVIALVITVIYRVMLGDHEDDQLFLSSSEAALEQEQIETLAKIHQVEPVMKGLVIFTLVFPVVLGGIWFYQGLYG